MKRIVLTALTAITFGGLGFGQITTNQGHNFIRNNSNGTQDKGHLIQWNRLSLGLWNEGNSFSVEDFTGYSQQTPTNIKTRFKVNQNGNVGIGTASPKSKLHVKNGESSGIQHDYSDITIEDNDHGMINILTPNNKTGYYGFSDTDDNYVGGIQYDHSIDRMVFRVNNQLNNMTIASNGNVGVGISNPTKKLDVNGSVGAQEHIVVQKGGSYLVALNGTEHGYISGRDSSYTNKFHINSKGTSYFNGGNVGIGTQSPDEKLTVKGKIHAEEVRVDLNVPADYVFEKYYTGKSELKADYTMPTLEEVEAFTKANNHLPSIPSAKEIQEEGLHLKEMTHLLLQKIEELTLYTIEQQKQLKKQAKQLETQQKEIQILKEK